MRLALPQQSVELLARDARGVQLRLDLRAQGERALELAVQRREGRLAVLELLLELVAALGQILKLFLEPREGRLERGVRGAARLDLKRQLARTLEGRLGGRARCVSLPAQPLPLALELEPLRLERGERVDRGFHAPARRAQVRLGALELRSHVGERGLELAEPPRSIRLARLRRVVLRTPVHVFAVQPIHFPLGSVAAILVVADLLADELEPPLALLDLRLEPDGLGAQRAQRFLALDDARVRLGIARQAQPIGTQPDPVPRHHRLTGREAAAAHLERLGQGLGREHRSEHGGEIRRSRDLGPQARGIRARGRLGTRAHDRQMAAVEAREQIGDRIEAVHANGLEV